MASGPTLLVTRPQPQAGDWVRQLGEHGLQARAMPLLAVGPVADAGPLLAIRQDCPPGSLVMFVSPNAVLQAQAVGLFGAPWPDGVRAAATGPGTVAALLAAGVPAAQVVAPSPQAAAFDSEHLWVRLCDEDWRDRRVWIVRGEGGRDWFADTLRAAGARVALVQGYERGAPRWGPTELAVLQDALSDPASHVWLFSSSEGVGHLATLAPGRDWHRSRAWVTHPRIAQAVQSLGFGSVDLIEVGVDAVRRAVAEGASIQSPSNGES